MKKNTPSKYIAELLYRRIEGDLTPAEEKQLHHWMRQSPINHQLLEELKDDTIVQEWLADFHPENKRKIKTRVYKTIRQRIPIGGLGQILRQLPRWTQYAAAILIICVGFGIIRYYTHSKPYSTPMLTQEYPALDTLILPGKEGAVLTLANGRQIVLDSLETNATTQQPGVQLQINDGQLRYAQVDEERMASHTNTLSTPRGRQFSVQLPDGTQVWLNAASSITYPLQFEENQRIVKVRGEAFFEVARDETKPFKIIVNQQDTVSVLGTSFNVNAYTDQQASIVTLFTGHVRVSNPASQVSLKIPGQEAYINAENPIMRGNNKDFKNVVAWKNGIFNFNNTDLHDVMRQLSRWYDVDMVYENRLPHITLRGELQRDANFSTILRYLDKIGVSFRFEDGKLHVLSP